MTERSTTIGQAPACDSDVKIHAFDDLHRIGVAIIAGIAPFLYQKFSAPDPKVENESR